jgi:hypothetical protein
MGTRISPPRILLAAALVLAVALCVRLAQGVRALVTEASALAAQDAGPPGPGARSSSPAEQRGSEPHLAAAELHLTNVARASAPQAPAEATLRACADDLRLMASVYDAAHPSRSMAAVHARGGTRLLRPGQRIGDAELVAVRPLRAYFQPRDAAPCMLRVAPATGSKPPARPRVVARPAARTNELSAGIRQLGPHQYAVSRELLQKVLATPLAFRRGARIQVSTGDERVRGLELRALGQAAPLARLGLQRGDIVRSLNGHSLTAPDDALQAMAMLREGKSFSLAVLRGGRPITMSYQVE